MTYENLETPELQSKPLPFSRIGWALAAFIGIQQVLAGGIIGLVQTLAPHLVQNGWFLFLASYVPLYVVAFPIVLLILRPIASAPEGAQQVRPTRLGGKGFVMLVLTAYGVAYLGNIVSMLLTTLISAIKGSEVINPLLYMVEDSGLLATFVFMVIVAPIMEELLFRQILYKKLLPYGNKTYVFFTAITFALLHGNINQLIYAFMLGIVFAGVRIYTGSVKPCIALHMIINFLGSVLPLLLVADVEENPLGLGLYGLCLLAVVILGLVLGIRYLKKKEYGFLLLRGELRASRRAQYLNSGMVVYTLLMLLIVVSNLLL